MTVVAVPARSGAPGRALLPTLGGAAAVADRGSRSLRRGAGRTGGRCAAPSKSCENGTWYISTVFSSCSFQFPRKRYLWTPAAEVDLTLRRAIAEFVDAVFGAAQVLVQRRPLGRQACEHESAVDADARQAAHAEGGIGQVEILAVTARHRHRVEVAVGLECPAVIAAAEQLRVALGVVANDGAAMSAAVVDHVDLAVAVPRQHDRMLADPRGDEVAGLRHLAFVADIDPASTEDLVHLQVEHFRVEVERTVHPVAVDQGPDRLRIQSHGLPPKSEKLWTYWLNAIFGH